jgi:hypothetical protein
MNRSTRLLLAGGIVAAPLFVGLWAVQAFTREGFRPLFHPLSLLSLGDGGWVQIANFVLTGTLLAGAGAGLRRTSQSGAGSTWTALLVALMGAGLVTAGVFVTDAGAGFPEGAPEGAPRLSWHGAVHEVGFILTQLAFVALAIVLAVRSARARRRGWMLAGIVALVAAAGVAAVGSPDAMAIRLVASSAIELGLVAAITARALRVAQPAPSRREETVSL